MIQVKKLQFSIHFSQKRMKHSSTIALPWQQQMPMGIVCVQSESLSAYTKFTKFQLPTAYHFSTAEGISTPPPGLFRIKSSQLFCSVSEDLALPTQDLLHTETFMCDGNALIS